MLRIDDLDTPRNMPGAVPAILDCLHGFGLEWDGEVHYESRHLPDYEQAIAQLSRQGRIYACTCSRKQLQDYHGVYPGFCRDKQHPLENQALRLKTTDMDIVFEDEIQGRFNENMALQHGDFIVKRRDGIFAYQLAVVVDDYLQQVNRVVRGFDLLESTAKQLLLQQLLAYPTPNYLHLPVIVDREGNKLSKQTRAEAVDSRQAPAILFLLLNLLKQNPPPQLKNAGKHDILEWAVAHWRPEQLKNIRTIQPTIDLSL